MLSISLVCIGLLTLQPIPSVVAQILLGQQSTNGNGTPETPKGKMASIVYHAPNSTSRGTAATREGRIGMGECPNADLLMTAIVPEIAVQGEQGRFHTEGQTVSAHPTLWFYVPYSKGIPASFILQDSEGNEVYSKSISLPQNPGIMAVEIPAAEAPALQLNQLYRWQLQVECSQPPIQVTGWIKRVEIPTGLEQSIRASQQPQQKAVAYAANKIWYDAVTVLAKELRRNPNNPEAKQHWNDLLNQVGLQSIATTPFTE
jgi:hypothetical protein